MIPPNSAVYLETSALNFMASWHGWSDGKATKIYHAEKGTRFYLSPITLWEVLLTKDTTQRERLIFYMQNIGYSSLLKTPGELIVDYISRGLPLVERGPAPHSKSSLSKTWADVAGDDRKTFVLDHESLSRLTVGIRTTFERLSKLWTEPKVKGSDFTQQDFDQLLFSNILKRLKLFSVEEMTPQERLRFKLTIALILLLLCEGFGLDNGGDQAVKQFWALKGIEHPWDRLTHILEHYELLVFQGPFAAMAEMALLQASQNGRLNRGTLWDVLHSIYLIYVDYFFTADKHFKAVRDQNDHPVFNRVVYLPEVTLTNVKTIGIYRRGQFDL